jgi:hypothetical protein
MTTPEWISVIALTISTGGFVLQARSWLISGPRLRLSIVADAVSVPSDDKKGSVALVPLVLARVDTLESLSHVIIFGSIMVSEEWQTSAA